MAARLASKAQYDARALAQEATRENLIDPRRPSSNEMLSGGSATPSMGLSQIRGGRAQGSTKVPAPGKLGAMKGGIWPFDDIDYGKPSDYSWDAPWDWQTFWDGFSLPFQVLKKIAPALGEDGKDVTKAIDTIENLAGKGRMKTCGGRAQGSDTAPAPGKLGAMKGGKSRGSTKAPAAGLLGATQGDKSHHEPLLLGRELAEHILDTKGPGFAKAFIGGLMHGGLAGGNLSHSGPYEGKGGLHGGGWLDYYDNVDWNAAWTWDDFAKGFKDGFSNTLSVAKYPLAFIGPEGLAMAGAIKALGFGKGKKKLMGGGGMVGGGRIGGGSWDNEPGPDTYDNSALASQRAAADATAAKAAAIMGGRRRRAPAKVGDGRLTRAAIVKQVMQEKGLKLIEASKYVKAHNLYEGKGY